MDIKNPGRTSFVKDFEWNKKKWDLWVKSSFVWGEEQNLYRKSNKPGKSSTKAYPKDIQCQDRKEQ